MESEADRPLSARDAVTVGGVSGLVAVAPFVLIGRLFSFHTIAVAGIALFYLGDPWLTVPVFLRVRASRLGCAPRLRYAALAGLVSGIVVAATVAISMTVRGHASPRDLGATAVYPLVTVSYSVLAAVLSGLGRHR